MIVFLVFVVILIIVLSSKYNQMVRYRNKVAESLRLIDIHLKLRFDLIPNLVTTVKAYTKHEKEVFEKLIELRSKAANSTDEKEKIELANEIVPNIRHLLFVAEDYPELKADALYKSLMEELILVEDKIAAARRFYDSNVNEYNTLIGVFPNNIVANMFGFTPTELFKIDVGENFSAKINMDNK